MASCWIQRFILLLCLTAGAMADEYCPPDCRCLFGQATMMCNNINLQLPPTISPTITVLTFTNCFLGETWPKLPANYSNIESLTIRASQFSRLQDRAFENLPKLHLLNLHDNKLQDLDKDILKDLPELADLHLQLNNIAKIEDDTFEHNPKLQTLILNDNPNLELSARSFAQPEDVPNHLYHIELRNTGLTTVPTASLCHSKLPALNTLDLSKNDFRNLTELLFKHAPGLTFLNLDSCNLPSIQRETLGALEHLETLFLSNNAISFIDEQAFDDFFSSMRFLHLEYNQLTTASYKLFNYDQLRVLNASYNPWECSCQNQWLQSFPALPNNTNFIIMCASPEKYKDMNALEVMTTKVTGCEPMTSASSSPNPMIAVYVAIPIVAILTIITVVIVVKICKLKKREKRGSTQYSLVYKPTTEKA